MPGMIRCRCGASSAHCVEQGGVVVLVVGMGRFVLPWIWTESRRTESASPDLLFHIGKYSYYCFPRSLLRKKKLVHIFPLFSSRITTWSKWLSPCCPFSTEARARYY